MPGRARRGELLLETSPTRQRGTNPLSYPDWGFILAMLWAVHIPDGVLTNPWLLGGGLVAAGLAYVGARRIRDDEIPRVALLSAVFFIASSIHLRVGPTSVHLLLNGLVGAVLGWRAALAIPIGLFLQAALIGHGAYYTLGVNSCVLVLPALLAGWFHHGLRRLPWASAPWLRSGVVGLCAAVWLLSACCGGFLLLNTRLDSLETLDLSAVGTALTHPVVWAVLLPLIVLVMWLERRLDHPPEFPLGLLLGELTVLVTLALNSAVLLWGGVADWQSLVVLVFLAHLPVAVIEGTVLGFTMSFLVRVRPQMFDQAAETDCVEPAVRDQEEVLAGEEWQSQRKRLFRPVEVPP